jgi:hypothetical protein
MEGADQMVLGQSAHPRQRFYRNGLVEMRV